MARRSQCSSAGDNPLDPNYLPPHYREEYRLAIDALVEGDLEGYYQFLQKADVVDFLSTPEIDFIQHSVQAPKQSSHLEQHFLESVGDGSSDTYWPIHSDLDVPGLDLGWPQLHPFIGPTEVTTLVNPPEPDMPSIKEQARRLIKNAQQVIAIVMDMFTDVDVFADILNAAMRNVAVYILLDEQNAHHFINMVSNCRVNLQTIQFLRVRTVSGITYQCRSGKSFKGQMMDRFLLTDCRAVLSGNYSFMWSFEKLHRCMAHLFLGQLVTTFDEEFRILFAQSQPLMIENVLVPVEEFGLLHKRQHPNEKALFYREPRKFLAQDIVQPDEWVRHSYDERVDGDWRMMALKKQESLRGPGDMYRRHATQQPRMDPCFDQGPSRMPIMDNPAYKRHSYAEGVQDRYSSPFLQQGMPDTDIQGKYFHKGQQPFPGPGPEPNYSGYEKFWNQDYQSAEHYSEPGLPQEPPDNFDPVLNYLSSTRNLDFDQSSEKLQPAVDLPISTSHPKRLSFGQPYVCQISPTPSSSADQKQFFQDQTTDRKDPTVKRGLRNWRISSYLSTYENPGEEGLPMVPLQTEAFEEPPNPIQQTSADIDLPALKIPNVREFKVPAVPRASQMPSYAKTKTQEQPKRPLNEPIAVAAEIRTTRTPSESSSTAEREKAEAMEQKELKTIALLRDDSFKRKYNAAVPRSSRLRSSLIFSSLDQQQTSQETTGTEQPDEQSDKNEAEPTKPSFVSHVLGQRRSAPREPFEWSRYVKSATFDNSSTETSKPDDESSKGDDKDSSKVENSKDISEKPEVKESLKPKDAVQDIPSPSVSQSKPSGAELPKTEQPVQPPKPLIKTPLYMDMSDPDNRLMFFKELAAKRKAAKAAKATKSKEKVQIKPPTDLKDDSTSKKEEPSPNVTSESKALTSEGLDVKIAAAENAGEMVSTEASKSAALPVDTSDDTSRKDNIAISDASTSQHVCDKETKVSADSGTAELDSQSAAPVSAEPETCQTKSPEEPTLSSSPAKDSSNPPTPTNATTADVSSLKQGTDESPTLDSASEESDSVIPSSVEVPLSSELDVNAPDVESVQSESNLDSFPSASEPNKGPESSSSSTSVQSPSSDPALVDPASPSSPTTGAQTSCSKNIPGDSSVTLAPSILFPSVDKTEGHETVSSSLLESSCSAKETSQKSTNPSSETHLDSVPRSTSSETPPAADSALMASGISSDTNAADPETTTTLSLQSTAKTTCEELSDATTSADGSEKPVSKPENDNEDSGLDICSSQKSAAQESDAPGSPKADSTSLSLSTTASELDVLGVSGLESSAPKLDLKETVSPVTTPENVPPQPLTSQTSALDSADITPCPAQSEAAAPSQDTPTQATTPHDLHLTDFDASTPAETISCSTPPESDQPVLLPKTEKTETNKSALDSLSDKDVLAGETQQESEDSLVQPLTNLLSRPTEPTSKSPADVNLPCKTSESDTPESHTSEAALSDESSKVEPEIADAGERKSLDVEDTNKSHKSSPKGSVSSEETSDQVKQSSAPTEIMSKQPKLNQSRYHSSTANVLSSSNLRDDTKLLLEQISANCQSRNETTKESPVTDDEKEDEADKNAKKEKETGFRTLSRGQPKSAQEREKLLERIQSMRKERKVYSRFEMAP